jgi:hypothetical protein
MSKQLAESLIRLAGLYFIATSLISLAGVVVKYLQTHLSDRMGGMGMGDFFWIAISVLVSLLAGVIILKKAESLAELVVPSE